MAEKKYVGHISRKQKEKLVEIVASDEEIRAGKFTNKFTKKEMRDRWDKISVELNCIPGARKTGEQWKRAWKDLKINVKKKNAVLKDYMKGTGGGPAIKNELDMIDERILNILGTTLVEGDTDVLESTSSITVPLQAKQDESSHITELDISKEKINLIEGEDTVNLEFFEEHVDTETKNLSQPEALEHKVRSKRRNRLTQVQKNTDKLVTMCNEKCKIKKEYYEKKLGILKERNNQLKRIADSLYMIGSSISEMI